MEETLKCFLDTIAAAAREDRLLVEQEAAAAREEAMERLRREAEQTAEQVRRAGLAQVQSAGAETLAARRTENRRELLERRKNYSYETMVKVKAKTRGYTTLPEYPERLLALVEKALDCLGRPQTGVLYLRREDMGHGSYIRPRVRDTILSLEEGDFALGGVIVACPERGLRADLSFDTAFQDAVDRFGELSGLGLE